MWLRFKAAIALAKRGASFSSFSRFLAQREATPKVARSPLLALRETFGEAKRAKRAKREREAGFTKGDSLLSLRKKRERLKGSLLFTKGVSLSLRDTEGVASREKRARE
jgi:hypothetical protein